MCRRGFAPVILLIIAAILVAGMGGYIWFVAQKARNEPTASKQAASSTNPAQTSPTSAATIDISNWKTYRNEEYGFVLKYPPSVDIEVRSSIDSRYEKDFHFKMANLTRLVLQTTDLKRYLPLTNTPTISKYLQTFRQLEKFNEATIAGKPAYEYLICGGAACSQEVMFVHDNIQYEFSINYGAYFPGGQIRGDVDPRSITFEGSPIEIQEIIGSIGFLASQ